MSESEAPCRRRAPVLYATLLAGVLLASLPAVAAPAQPAPAEPAPGAIRIDAAELGSRTLQLDGVPVAIDAPELESTPPGRHRLSVHEGERMVGFQDVVVESGMATRVHLAVASRTPGGTGSLAVRVPFPRASLTVDGGGPYRADRPIEGLATGPHILTVEAPGFFPLTRQVIVERDRMTTVDVELLPAGELRVELARRQGKPARVALDGETVGQTPWTGLASPGPHVVTIDRGSDFAHQQSVAVEAGRLTRIVATPEHVPDPTRRFTHGASLLEAGTMGLDLSVGWPYLAELRLVTGVLDAFDIHLGFASAAHISNTFTLGGRLRFARGGVATAAAALDLGWGFGGNHRRSMVITPGLRGSIALARRAELTLLTGVRIFSDRTGPKSDPVHSKRDAGVQLPLALALDLQLGRRWNLFMHIEGNPLVRDRRLLQQGFLTDSHIYGRLGLSRIW